MKRLALFCDGTWNKLSSSEPTNVVMAARALRSQDKKKIQQLTYYHEGVGTSFNVLEELETKLAGAFGLGLFEKIADAYRFLVFNYVPGDEIYVFGFSRGAFTARSLTGLIRKCGILRKDRVDRIGDAFVMYKDPTIAPSDQPAKEFRRLFSHEDAMTEKERRERGAAAPTGLPAFSVTYLGVWDTVGALGIPNYISDATVDKYRFHDGNLSSMVVAARHAVAIDEARKAFNVTMWTNVGDTIWTAVDETKPKEDLNTLPGRAGHYQQLWFPGDHGSVGGGGKVRGLSNSALLWVIEGAQKQGLAFDEAMLKKYREAVDYRAPLRNTGEEPGLFDVVKDHFLFPTAPRPDGARVAWGDLSRSAQNRLVAETKDALFRPYRPEALTGIRQGLADETLPGEGFTPWDDY